MSWFTEIAGKAEDLLNKVDQTAATALQTKKKSGVSSTNIYVNKAEHTHYSPNGPYASMANNSASSPPTLIPSSKASPSPLTPRKKPESDDEKLLRFLNCEETLPSPPRKYKLDLKDSVSRKLGEELEDSMESPDLPQRESEKMPDSCDIESSPQEDTKLANLDNQNVPVGNTLEKDTTFISTQEETKDSKLTPKLPQSTDGTSEEISLATKRAEYAEAEMKRMQRKLDHWNSQISGNDKVVRELQEREKDMTAAVDAKDSQIAILKVRLQEADQELRSKISILEELRTENQRIINDHADGATFQNQTIQSLRDQLQGTEGELGKSRDALHQAQGEHMQVMGKMEEEHRHLAESYSVLQKKWSEINDRNKNISSQLKISERSLDVLQQEYSDYKQKAQRILQSKEKLIASLKEGNLEADDTEKNEAASALLFAEVDGIKQERELLREELRRANELVDRYRTEIQELEKISQQDLSTSQENCKILKEQLLAEVLQKEEAQLLNNHLKEELQYLGEDHAKTRTNLQTRIQDREIEIEKLRRQLTAKSLSTVSQDELESRLHALTENLIQKQTTVEALSTEKNSLVLQLERLEQQLKEAQRFGSQNHTYVGVNSTETEPKMVKSTFLENPFDSPFTRKVKRVYGSIDAFSIRLGVFLRRYPITRVFVIVYMLLLHFWVMIVLLTYEPEIHNSSYELEKKQ